MSIPTSVEAVGDASFEMAIKQALQETMFLNALGINPRQLRDVIQSLSLIHI